MRSIAVSSRRWTGKSKADGRPTSRKKQRDGDNSPKPAEVVLLVGAHGSPALGLQGLLRCAAITSPCMPRGLVISATRASRPWRWRAVPWPWGPEPGPDRLRAPPARLGTGRCPRGAPARPVAGWAGAEAWALAAPTGVRVPGQPELPWLPRERWRDQCACRQSRRSGASRSSFGMGCPAVPAVPGARRVGAGLLPGNTF